MSPPFFFVFFRLIFPALATLALTVSLPSSFAGLVDPLPTITSADRLLLGPQQPVIIAGTNFIGISSVKFAGVEAVSFSTTSQISILAVAPSSFPASGAITVTNSAGTATSSFNVTFTSPNIGSPLTNATVSAGGRISFTVAPKVWGTGTLSYQWKKDGVSLSAVPGNIAGVTSDTLVLTNVQAANAASAAGYTVVVTDSIGTVTSTAATLRVSAPPLAWNPATEFSVTKGNPNGVWSYGSMDTGFVTFTPYVNTGGNSSGYASWYGSGGDQTPTVALNGQTTPFNGVPAGYVLLHPSNGNEPSVLRWTAPLTAAVRVTGQFHAGDGGAMQVAVRHNNSVRFSATDAGVFDLTLNVVSGDRLDFAVFGGFTFGSTGLQLNIAAVTTALPLTTADSNKLSLGTFAGGTQVRIDVTGTGDLVDSRLQVFPDGSLAGPAGAPWVYANSGAAYPGIGGFPAGDGLNHYPGGGLNYDANSGTWLFAGKLTSDTTDPATIRAGAVVGTFVSSPVRSDWFAIGFGGTFTVPAGGATLYLAVNEAAVPTANSDNHGSYAISYSSNISPVVSVPLTTLDTNKLSLGTFGPGAVLHISVTGSGNLAATGWSTKPDGSLASAATGPFTFANVGTAYPNVASTPSGDGLNRFPGGGANYDYNGSGFPFAGKLTTDTSDVAAIRFGALVGTYATAPTRNDWFLIGNGGAFTVPPGTGTLSVAVNETFVSDNNGSYNVVVAFSPVNDNFAARSTILNSSATVIGNNSGGTKEVGETNHATNPGGASSWWTWTAPKTGVVTVSTVGSSFDTLLAVYTGTAVGSLTLIASDDNSGPSNTSQLTFNATAGTAYQIAVDGKNSGSGAATGNITLHLGYAYYFSTFAGLAGNAGSTNATGRAARFSGPNDVVVDSSGNLYVGENVSHTIRKITPAGVVTTLAGSAGLSGTANGTGTDARFKQPLGLALDGGGNILVADYENHSIRKVTPAGVVTTVAGLVGTSGPDNATGTAARFNFPVGLTVDTAGNIFVADSANHVVRKITAGGVVTTFAGTMGTAGSADGAGTAAKFNNPYRLAFDPSGNLYVSDTFNHTIRKITPAGVVTTLAGAVGVAGGIDGAGNSARFNNPYGLAVDVSGNVFTADYTGHTLRRITPSGVVTTLGGLAGTFGVLDGTGSDARFNQPTGVALDSSGNLFISDFTNQTIRKGVPAFAPEVASVSPGAFAADGTVTITGANFTAATAVAFNGTPAAAFTVVSPTTITATAPAALTAGFVTVAGPGGTSTVAAAFTVGVPAPSANDRFDPNANGPIHATVVQPDGKIIIAGDFTTLQPNLAATATTATRLARLNRDGSVDATFTASADQAVFSLALQADGKILIGGSFTSVNSTTRNRVARLNANGTLDSDFNPNANGGVNAIAVQSDGKILLGGSFSTLQPPGAGSAIARTKFARLLADGTLDSLNLTITVGEYGVRALLPLPDGSILVSGDVSTVNSVSRAYIFRITAGGALDAPLPTTPVGLVSNLARQVDGKILLGGEFTSLGSVTGTSLARLNADLTLDTGFNPAVGFSVKAITTQADGKIVVGGGFTTVAGQTRKGLARFRPDGTLDTGFVADVSNSSGVNTLALQPDGSLVVGGDFTTLATHGRGRIARVLPDGSLERALSADTNGIIEVAVRQPDGKTIIGGTFTTVAGVARTNLARLNADSTLDTGFDDSQPNGTVRAIVVQPDAQIVIGGTFTSLTNLDASRTGLARLTASGGLDSSFNAQLNGSVTALALQSDGKIIVGGGFTQSGATPRNRVARFTSLGALDTFDPNLDSSVTAIAVQADSKVLVGGSFTLVGAVGRNGLARVEAATGAAESGFNPGANGGVNAIVVLPSQQILVGGQFTTIAGNSANYVARLNSVGGFDGSFNATTNQPVKTLALAANGKLAVGGTFTSITNIGSTARDYLALLDASTGAPDPTFNVYASDYVNTASWTPDGKLTVAGNFTNIGGQARARLARLASTAPTETKISATASTVTLTRSGPLPEVAWVTFEKSSDGVTGWSALGTAARVGTTANWQLAGQALAGNTLFYLRARAAAPSSVYGSSSLVEHVQQVYLVTLVPAIASISPSVLGIGAPVTIIGTNFTGATEVRFNGITAASFTVDSPTQITAIVPSGVTAGAVTVVSPSGTATSPTNYTTTTAPLIVSIDPTSGTVGRIVTILGGNFGGISNFSTPSVSFNGIATTAQRQAVPGGFRVAVPTGATTGPITVTVSGVPVVSATFTVLTTGTAPANDDFANAQVIVGPTGVIGGTTAFASKQSGEPNLASAGTRSVWFSWVAPSSGAFLFDQSGSEFGAYLGVYTGSAVNALTLRATGDQPNTFAHNYSPAALVATAGTTYFIAVDGFQGTSGQFKLAWAPLAAPTIASFTPTSAYAGSAMTITGTNFTRGMTVTIGGVSINTIPSSASSLVVFALPRVLISAPVVATTVAGTATSGTDFTVPAQPSGGGRALINLSALTTVGTGANAAHSNFSIEGSTAKIVLVRVVGPKLASFGVTGFLADPKLEIFNGQGQSVAQNDDWDGGTAMVNATAAAGAFTLISGSKDAAALVTLSPGTYTVRAEGVGATSGQALVEIYDTETSLRIPYMALRQQVNVGANVIAGFVFTGPAQRLLIRAVGPALSTRGLAGALANPTLSVFSGSQVIAANDNWGTASANPTLAAAAATAGLFPLADGSNDAALLVDLVSGSYTVQVSGVSSTSGITQIEVAQIDTARAASFAPALLVPPQSATIVLGGSATFSAPAIGSPVPTYQWLRAGVPISTATNASLPFTNLQSSDAANYTVVMTNSAGTTTSAPFVLFPPVPLVASVSPTTVTSGATVTLTGTGFTAASIVRFNGLAAAFTVVSDTSITATVPLGVTSGAVTVTSAGGTSAATVNFTATVTPVVQTLYVATGQGSNAQLYIVNPATAAATLIGNITMGGSALTMTGLAFHPLTGVLYGVTGGETGPSRKLVTINPANGLATLVGTLMVGDSVVTATDITFDANGKLYVWKSSGGPLGTVNLSTAAVILVGSSLNGTQGNGLAFTPDGLLYVAGPSTGNLGRVDPATGVLTVVAALSAAPSGLGAINAMTSNLAGALFAVDKDAAKLITINAATGAITAVGTLPFTNADAIAFAITPPVPAPLIHRYSFDAGTVTDLVGSDHGTLVNGATITGGRLVLDGTDDHVQFAANLVPANGDFSVAFFAQQLSVQAGFREIISQGTTGGPGFFIGHDPSRLMRVGDGWLPTGQPFPNDGLLHHYAVTGDATNTKLYIDGVLVQSKGDALSRSAAGTHTRLGAQFEPFAENFHGALDEVRIYGGALTAAEVAALAGAVPPVITTPPVAFASGGIGGNVTLSVAATGAGPLTYQWRKFGQPIVGAINATLTLSAHTLFDAGLYDVVVSNNGTPLASSATRVVVNAPIPTANVLTASSTFAPRFENAFASFSLSHRAADGKVYLSGNFSSLFGALRPGFARLLAEGTLDTAFIPAPVRHHFYTSRVYSVAVQADGRVLIGGQFDTVGGVPRDGLARLNLDGTVDPTFVPPIRLANSDRVLAVAVQLDGKILVAGSFNDSGVNIARLNADGSRDSTFAVAGGFSGTVYTLALQSDGKVIVGGSLQQYQGTSIGNIARLTSTGALDPDYRTAGGAGFNGVVRSLVLQSDGKLVVGGEFTSYGGSPRNRLVRLLDTGALDPDFSIGNGFSNTVSQLALQSDGAVLVVGDFTAFDSNSNKGIVRLTSTGARDITFVTSSELDAAPGFNDGADGVALLTNGVLVLSNDSNKYASPTANVGPLTRLTALGALDPTFAPATRSAGSVEALVPAPGGRWFVAGAFTHVNGVARKNLARLLADGSLDPDFTPIGNAFNGSVLTVAVQPDGKVVAGGQFTAYDDTFVNRIVRLTSTGARDTTFDAGTGFDLNVAALALQVDGKLLVGGSFTTFNNVARRKLVRLTAGGALDPTFTQTDVGFGLSGSVNELAVLGDGRVYAAGDFTAYAGTARYRIARFLADGSLDSTFPASVVDNSNGINGTINALVVQPDGKLLVGGQFYGFGDFGTNGLARINADGTRDTTFAAFQTNGNVTALSLQSDGRIVVGGTFTSNTDYPPLPLLHLVRVSVTGVIEPGFGVPLFNSTPTAIQPSASGALLITGGSLYFPGTISAGLARLDAAPVPSITTPPVTQVASVGGSATFSVTAAGSGLTYRWLKDGGFIGGATGTSFTIPSAQLADVGSYAVVITNIYGAVTSSPALLTGSGPAPTITGQPATVSVPAGTTATLTVTATGATHYQWRKLGVPLAAATNATFTIAGAKLGDAGLYDVLVGNGLSVTRPAVGRLAVTNASAVQNPLVVDRAFPAIFESGGDGYGQPRRLLVQPDGSYYIAGDFSSVDGVIRFGLARFSAAGVIEAGFAPEISEGSINALARQADGKLVIVGDFHRVNGVECNHIARLNANGTLDTTFVQGPGTGTHGSLYAVAIQVDQKILIGGGFSGYGSATNLDYFARLNNDGSLDDAFNSVLQDGFNNTVLTIAVHTDGRIYVGGYFTQFNESSSANHLVVLNTDGTRSALTGFPVNAFESGTRVETLVVHPDGKMVLAGSFNSFGGVSVGNLVGLNADGSPDPTYRVSADGGANSTVTRLVRQSDGSVYVAGYFSSFDRINGSVVRLSPTGVVDRSFILGGSPEGLAIGSGDHLLVVGNFDAYYTAGYASFSPRAQFARFDSAGALTASQVIRWGSLQGTVRTMVPAPDGKWLVGGSFSRIGGRLIQNLARLNADGSNDLTFPAAQSPLYGSVLAITVQGDGKILVGGEFTDYGTDNSLVGAGRLLRLNADGTRDATFKIGEGFNATVTTLTLQADGKIIVGGDFTTLDGRTISARLVRLLADGTVDTSFLSGTGLDVTPYAIIVQRDDKIVVGGGFYVYNTASVPGLIRLHQNGVLDPTLASPVGFVGQGVRALVLQANEQLIIGGHFGFHGEEGISRWGIGRFNADGSPDTTFNTGTGFTSFALESSGGTVTSLALQGDGQIIAAGYFSEFNGVDRRGLARLNADGTLDTTFANLGGDLYSEHNSVVLRPDGSLLLAGDALDVNGTHRQGLIAITGAAPAPTINVPPVAQSAVFGGSATFSVTASGRPATTFQWQRNGVDLPGATNATYTVTAASQANAGLYRVIVSNSGGSVPSVAVPFDVVTRNLINFYASAALPAKGSITSSFTVEGTEPKSVLLIGVGGTRATVTIFSGGGDAQLPAAAPPRSPSVLDPRLRLVNAAGSQIAENNDWSSAGNAAAITLAAAQVGATPGLTATGEGAKDAAMLVTLAPGTYTVTLDGAEAAAGSGLLQIYDADTDGRPRLVMFTLRANVGSGDKTVVAGFTIDGTLQKTVLLRALGDSLGASTGVLQDTYLTFYRGPNFVDSNDDSSISDPVALAAHAQVGVRAFTDTLDSTLLRTLAPGAYTAQIRPLGSESFGTALFELFEVDAQRPATIAPVITYLAANQSVVQNDRAYFGVVAVAKPAPTYQWRKNGTPLSTNVTSHNPVLELPNVQPADADAYDVVITSGANILTSPARTLTLLPEFHASDSNSDRRIGLIELTRIIQFYNYRDGTVRTGEYRTLAGTEDGFTLGPGAITNFHSGDSNRDGRFDIFELTRVIELYNFLDGTSRTGAYHAEAGTEDGFAPGPRVILEGVSGTPPRPATKPRPKS